ncbi:Hypothetical predicted protein [Octopus vulgaris]|uniref:Uncharacterized protein n=1 Tax=Octopus vulgaris TaxID=6645 RepID=A0AA36BMA8_OCTVU|nr:Hypothetical predicted protein [Octopus vulgaris]
MFRSVMNEVKHKKEKKPINSIPIKIHYKRNIIKFVGGIDKTSKENHERNDKWALRLTTVTNDRKHGERV